MIWAGLALQAVVFALWVWQAFRVLRRLSGWARRESGLALPGPRWTLRGFAAFWRAADFADDRRRIGVLTLVLAGVMIANRVIGGPCG